MTSLAKHAMGAVAVSAQTDARAMPLVSKLVLFAAVSLLANLLGPLLRYPEVGAAVLFPPYAVLTAALVASPARHWPWYIGIGGATHLMPNWGEWSLTWVLFADLANVARALVAALFLRLLFRGPPRFDGIRALLLFVAAVAVVAPAAAAALGAANVALHKGAAMYWPAWRAWFMSNALTGLTMVPLCVIAITSRRLRVIDRHQIVEAAFLALAFAATCGVALVVRPSGPWGVMLPLYAPWPVLIWAALRFGPGGASLVLTSVVLVAIWGVDRGAWLFLAPSRDANLLALQMFVLLTALPVLCIAAVGSARHDAVQLYQTLLTSLQEHVAIIDARGVVLEANDAWRAAAVGDAPPLHRVHAGDDYLATCRVAAAQADPTAARALAGVTEVLSGTSRRFEMEYTREHEGRTGYYAMSVDALEQSEGGAVVMRTDISVRRRAQEEIDEQRRELAHLARVAVLGQFTGALVHELSQPLGAILTNSEAARLLLRVTPVDQDELRAIVDDIVDDDRRAGEVIQRLRGLLKRGEIRLQPVDPRGLVDEVLRLAQSEMTSRRVKAKAVVGPDVPPVLADRVQLQQVLLNLILNACEAMNATTSESVLVVSVRAGAAGDVLFSVRDTGPGIRPDLLPRLFDPFVSTKPEGLGLGLSISRTIVEAHGGRLWAENNADGGATLHCLLACVRPASDLDRSERVMINT